jgi:ATP-dependent DNA ligase
MQHVEAELRFIEPMECKLVPSIPDGTEWQYEVKLDRWRAIAIKHKNEVLLYSRNGNLLNGRFPALVDAIQSLPAKRFMLDGEIVALDEEGHHSCFPKVIPGSNAVLQPSSHPTSGSFPVLVTSLG